MFCLCVCASVSLQIISKTTGRNWYNLVGIFPAWWSLKVLKCWWHLTLTFDLESYFCIFLIQAIPFERLYLANSFSVWRYIFRISRSRFSVKVMGLRSRSRQRKAVAYNSKTTGPKLPGLDWNICYDNTRSNLELLTFWPWPLTLKHIIVIFQLKF